MPFPSVPWYRTRPESTTTIAPWKGLSPTSRNIVPEYAPVSAIVMTAIAWPANPETRPCQAPASVCVFGMATGEWRDVQPARASEASRVARRTSLMFLRGMQRGRRQHRSPSQRPPAEDARGDREREQGEAERTHDGRAGGQIEERGGGHADHADQRAEAPADQ